MAELQKVDDWLSALLANLEPAARSRMMRQLAQELRRTQQQNIRMQRNPDGSSYEPRRVTARSKKGRIKRQMFTKLRTTKYLKTAASADSASVQFEGNVQRIARVHHYGLRDRVSRKGPEIRYAERKLLGFSSVSINVVHDIIARDPPSTARTYPSPPDRRQKSAHRGLASPGDESPPPPAIAAGECRAAMTPAIHLRRR